MTTVLCQQCFKNICKDYRCREKDIPYLDPLQRGGGLSDALWHIKAFGGADFGIDQPLLEVSQGRTKPLLQQTLLILTLPGRTKAEAGGKEKR